MTETLTAAIWRHMLAQGGRWTVSELAALNQCGRRKTDKLLMAMAGRGLVMKYSCGGNRKAYGVHAGCKIPLGVTLDEVLTACGPGANDTSSRRAA